MVPIKVTCWPRRSFTPRAQAPSGMNRSSCLTVRELGRKQVLTNGAKSQRRQQSEPRWFWAFSRNVHPSRLVLELSLEEAHNWTINHIGTNTVAGPRSAVKGVVAESCNWSRSLKVQPMGFDAGRNRRSRSHQMLQPQLDQNLEPTLLKMGGQIQPGPV